MLNRKITRKEFLKSGLIGILCMLTMPILRLVGPKSNTSHKEARYYKNLAG